MESLGGHHWINMDSHFLITLIGFDSIFFRVHVVFVSVFDSKILTVILALKALSESDLSHSELLVELNSYCPLRFNKNSSVLSIK